MKMKDKLVKFGHKKSYYTMKKCVISFAVFAGLAVSASIPLSMKYLAKTPIAPHAETTEKVEPQDKADEDVETKDESKAEVEAKSLLSY